MWTTTVVQVRVVSRKIYCNSRSEMIVMLKDDTNFKGNIKLGLLLSYGNICVCMEEFVPVIFMINLLEVRQK